MIDSDDFGRWLRDHRIQLGLTQQQLADRMYVSHVAISHWENNKRLPDVGTLTRLAACLGVSDVELLDAMHSPLDPPSIILVDDEEIILKGSLHAVSEAVPEAHVFAFSNAQDAMDFARNNDVDIAFLDIELSGDSGLDLADRLKSMHPRINIIYVTAYSEYMGHAWQQNASGYVIKPLTVDRVRQELRNLRSSIWGLQL